MNTMVYITFPLLLVASQLSWNSFASADQPPQYGTPAVTGPAATEPAAQKPAEQKGLLETLKEVFLPTAPTTGQQKGTEGPLYGAPATTGPAAQKPAEQKGLFETLKDAFLPTAPTTGQQKGTESPTLGERLSAAALLAKQYAGGAGGSTEPRNPSSTNTYQGGLTQRLREIFVQPTAPKGQPGRQGDLSFRPNSRGIPPSPVNRYTYTPRTPESTGTKPPGEMSWSQAWEELKKGIGEAFGAKKAQTGTEAKA